MDEEVGHKEYKIRLMNELTLREITYQTRHHGTPSVYHELFFLINI